jgi:hypothetical protein
MELRQNWTPGEIIDAVQTGCSADGAAPKRVSSIRTPGPGPKTGFLVSTHGKGVIFPIFLKIRNRRGISNAKTASTGHAV